ncbi:outer membrane homotrimeric porin [Solidesulfovibrio sp.]|uniref:outer membrane homotrimeric porin n=1 Tax=Solidesulfovibrio sp. TaxID=2910990 RepID=UPI002B1F9F2E|nr:outer membrane homotrimeric porin [Solidesulfovibrio sp.]MEA4856592.1 outer membrane homotrimeric porin [Solidesulfovibrio sp.]
MKRFAILAIAAALLLGSAMTASAATEVKMVGDAFVYGTFNANQNFTGWSTGSWDDNTGAYTGAGKQTEDRFQIWERFRLRTDFVANEAVKFRLGIKVEDTWGHGTLTAANPAVSIAVYQAFLQFKLPDCNVEVTAGLQDFSLPANAFFTDSVVFGGDRAAALTINAPINENFSVIAAYTRRLDKTRTYDTTTTQVGDELDAYVLALPITLPGFKVTPWGTIAVAGKSANYFTAGSYGPNSTFADSLLSAGTFVTPAGFRNNQNAYWWAGGTFEVTALDPVKFYADVIYGSGNQADRKKDQRYGWFVDFGAEYTGWDVLTPQIFGWWSTGEDKSTRNGSERMPSILSNWGPGNSFLFDCSQELLKQGNMGVNPIGSYGLGASLNNISFIEKLSNRVTFVYLRGNNSPSAIRYLNTYMGSNPYFTMGRDLTTNEYVMGANIDTTYQIYENLAAVMETGWAHGQFQTSVWGHRLAQKSREGDAWKVAFGLTYKF